MRKLVLVALAASTIGLVAAGPASAGWQCQGSEVACGSSAAKKLSKHARTAHATKSQKYASHKSRKYASRKGRDYAEGRKAVRKSRVTETASYGGGSTGIASYYSSGTRTASGARFNPGGMTAAHRSLPFGTRVLVTSAATGRSVTVTINDRGPFVKGRIIDLSRGAAQALGITGAGLARVSVSVVGG